MRAPRAALDAFFKGRAVSKRLFESVAREMARLGQAQIRVSKSQVAFRRRKNAALVWIPGQYLKDRPVAPLVLTLSFPRPDASPRWKQITAVAPKRFTHHLELHHGREIDGQVRRWLRRAWDDAA